MDPHWVHMGKGIHDTVYDRQRLATSVSLPVLVRMLTVDLLQDDEIVVLMQIPGHVDLYLVSARVHSYMHSLTSYRATARVW